MIETSDNQGQPLAHRAKIRTVRMGEISLGEGQLPIKTILGSCLGLALFDAKQEVGGLAHIVLPDSRGHEGPPGKFVDTAIPELIRLLNSVSRAKLKIAAKIAGGANMLNSSSNDTVGQRNYEAANLLLKKYEIPLIASHCGEDFGRRMTFYPASGRVTIEVVGHKLIDI